MKITREIIDLLGLNELMGYGSYGVVYSVKHDSNIVVKLTEEQPVEHYITNLVHPHIIKFLNASWNDVYNFWVVTYERASMNLGKYVKCTPYSLNTIFSIAFDVISAIKHMHANNLYHFDVSANNILLTNNTAKLADFDLTMKLVDHIKYNEIGHELVTVSYRPPELLFNDKQSNNAICGYFTDIWSFAVILLVLILRRNPFYNYIIQAQCVHERKCYANGKCVCDKCHVKTHLTKLIGQFNTETNKFNINTTCILIQHLKQKELEYCATESDTHKYNILCSIITQNIFCVPTNRQFAHELYDILSVNHANDS